MKKEVVKLVVKDLEMLTSHLKELLESTEDGKVEKPRNDPSKKIGLEDVRAVLAKLSQHGKTAEVKDLKNLTLGNINDLPDDKKKLMLSIIPSGSPLKRELYVTSPFGVRVHPISGAKKEHHGIDLRVAIGDGVFSPAIGRVSFAGVRGGYGNTVIVDHMYGFQTLYGHLSKLHVQAGEIVGKGKLLAEGGNSGSSTGPHLHYEIRYNGTPIDPKNFIDWNEKQFNILFEKERSVQWEYFLTVMGKN